MERTSSKLIALLRGINVGGHKPVPMADLRSLAAGLGFEQVETYIQSGNLVLSTELTPGKAEVALEGAIETHFGFAVDVLVRTAAQWMGYAAGSPFAAAERDRPQLLHLALCKGPAPAGAAEKLGLYLRPGETIVVIEDGVWIDFAGGVGTSKLSPAVLDRVFGAPVTARNWRTVQKLAEWVRA